jgi:hypothetical protein
VHSLRVQLLHQLIALLVEVLPPHRDSGHAVLASSCCGRLGW